MLSKWGAVKGSVLWNEIGVESGRKLGGRGRDSIAAADALGVQMERGWWGFGKRGEAGVAPVLLLLIGVRLGVCLVWRGRAVGTHAVGKAGYLGLGRACGSGWENLKDVGLQSGTAYVLTNEPPKLLGSHNRVFARSPNDPPANRSPCMYSYMHDWFPICRCFTSPLLHALELCHRFTPPTVPFGNPVCRSLREFL